MPTLAMKSSRFWSGIHKRAGFPTPRRIRPLSYQDDCRGRGDIVGYNPQVYADARAAVKSFLTTSIALGR